jgi:4a-hydroxytetrahydrobiopterin dehydratase
MAALDPTELSRKLSALRGWTLAGGRIEKKYRFSSFAAALKFVQQAALASVAQHRPDIVIHGSVVTLSLGTNSQGGVTEMDLELAGKLEALPHGLSDAEKETNA